MTKSPIPLNSAAYVRQSIDHEQGIKDQTEDCLALAQKEGWPEPTIYADNDVTASKGKLRPAYERLMADIKAGRVDGLLFTHNARLHRSPRELEDFMLAVGDMPIRTVKAGTYDLTTANGRFMARQFGIMAKYETDLLSERLRRRWLQNAIDGKSHGPVGFGWERVDGRDVIVPEEADVVRDIVQRILGGESIGAIGRSYAEAGMPGPGGKKFTRQVARQLALRPSNAGLAVHQGKVIGKATCEPIITEDEYHRLTALLRNPARRTSKTNTFRYLLSGIAVCGACGGTVGLWPGKGTREAAYVCRNACVGVRRYREPVDNLIQKIVCDRLAMPDARQLFASEPVDDDLVSEAQSLRAKMDEAADQYADDKIDARQLERITARLRDRLDKIERETRRSDAQLELADLATPDIADRWEKIPIERRRALVKLLVEVTFPPLPKRQPAVFDPKSVVAVLRGSSATLQPAPA